MNKNVVLAVAKRDLKSWFGNPTGYVFIMLFVGLACAALVFSPRFFVNNLATLDTLNSWFPYLSIAFVAAVTMGTWSSERSNGTQELLFTIPARDADLLLGKYLAALGIYTVSLLFMLTLPIGLSFLGSPDWGQIVANYVGFWLFGAMLVAVSMLGSQLSENMTVALILGGLASAIVVFSGRVLSMLGFGPGWFLNGPEGQFAEFARGLVTFSGILLFAGLAVAFFYLNLALLARRHYRGQDEGVHYGARFLSLAVGAIALTVIGVQALPRVDTTLEQIHSLGSESRRLLANLDPRRPVVVTAFVSEDVPQSLVQQKRTLLNLMDQFDRIGGNAVEQRVVITEPFSPQARDAEKNYGIQSRTLPDELGGTYTEKTVFLGFVVQSGTEEIVVPFVEPATPLEYELTRSIRVAAKADRKKVGVLKTDVELYGGFDFQTFAQKPRWQIVDELLLQYSIENVDADRDYPEGLQALIVPQPSSLVQEQMDRLQSWILAGNAALLLEDPAPLDAPGTAATDPKGGRQNMFGGPPPVQKGNFNAFLASLGASMQTDQVVWDLSYRTYAGGALPPEFLFVGGEGFAARDEVTSGLDRLVILLGGAIRELPKPGFSFAPLLVSPKPAELLTPSGDPVEVLGWVVDKPKDAGDGDSIPPDDDAREYPAELKIAFAKGHGFDAESFCRRLVGQSLRIGGRFVATDEDLDRLSVPQRIDGCKVTKSEGSRVEARLQLGVRMQGDGQGLGGLVLGGPNGLIPKLNVFVFNPFGGGQQFDPRRRHTPRPNDYVLGARITGSPAAEGGGAPRVILLGDLDMIGNQFFAIRRATNDANMRFDNVTFVLNCIDSLVGDDSLIELRKRRPTLRTLSRVEAAQRDFETAWLDEKERAESAAKKALDRAQKRLDRAVAKVRENPDLDEQAKEIEIRTLENSENRKLELERARIDAEKRVRIETARHQRDQQKLGLYTSYGSTMLLLSVLPAIAMGLLTFARRRAREAAIVPDRRRVKREVTR